MAKSKEEQIFVGNGDERIELIGQELAAFNADRKQIQEELALIETEYQARLNARESAIKKLAEVAGLTQEELASIL